MEGKDKGYDLAVVGAGVIGLSCGWRAAQAGLDVVVLERDEPGAGASGVAAGMLAPVTEAEFGEEELLALNLESRALWRGFAAELEELTGLPTGYEESGALVVAADRDDSEELRRLHQLQQRLGLQSEWLGPRAARRLEPALSPGIAGAISAPGDAAVDPGAVVKALRTALKGAGGRLRVGTEVTALAADGGRVTGVRLAGGETVRADSVLMCAGAWSAQGEMGFEAAAPEVRPVKGQLLELRVRRGQAPPAQRLIRTPRCYVVCRRGGEVVIGATMEEQGFDTTVTAGGVYGLLEAAYEVLPDTAELELVRAHAGLRPFTLDGRPVIEAGAIPGLVWATGHGRNGVLLAPVTARRVLDLVRERTRVGSA
ncbi:MAG: glycine oxidase ThiO [Actinomycetota bacterium]